MIMQIAILGSGGVGAYFGARLVQAGHDVRFLARGEHMEAIRKNGLLVKSILGDAHIHNINVTDEIKELGKVDLVIVAVKSWQVKEMAKSIAPILNKNGYVLPLQNGVLSYEELCSELPPGKVIKGLCRIFSMIEAPGVIMHKGVKPHIIFGEAGNEKTERVLQLRSIFEEAQIDNKLAEDIDSEIWKKFISICLSGLMAVSKTTYGEMRSMPQMRTLMFELLNEIYGLALEMGIKLDPDYVSKAVSFIESFNFDATASLTRDVWAGKPSEIEYQNGTVVRLAEELGLHVPVNRFVYYSILPQELKVRKQM